MMLSKKCRYGLLATVFVSLNNNGSYVPIRDISKQLNIPFHFLTKILQVLTAKSIMNSYKGPNGGIRLSKKPEDITIYDMVIAFEGSKFFSDCIMGLPDCSCAAPCPLHSGYKAFKENLTSVFKSTTMKQLADDVREQNMRLTDLELIK